MSNQLPIHNAGQLKGHKSAIYALTKGRNARTVISGGGEGWIVAWDLDHPETGKLIAQAEGNIFALEYLPELNQIVAGTLHGGVHWIHLDDPQQTKNIAMHRKGVFDFLRIDDFLFSAGGDGILTRWSIKNGQSIESLQLSGQALRSLDRNIERKEIAVGSSDGCIYFLDEATLAVRHKIDAAHDNSVFCIRYNRAGTKLISGGRDAMLKIWDLEKDYLLINSQAAHWYTINNICWNSDESIFVTASRDRMIKIWDAQNYTLLKVLEANRDGGHRNSVNVLHWQGDTLISGSDDRLGILWRSGS